LANAVNAVNQYAAPMYAATMIDARPAGARRITSSRPAVVPLQQSIGRVPCEPWLKSRRWTDRTSHVRAMHRPERRSAVQRCTAAVHVRTVRRAESGRR
jgi:hypothetical protein